MSRHTCHAKGCETACAPKLLMCPRHWRMVPKPLQDEVYRHFDPRCPKGQALPSRAWLNAAKAAIAHVAEVEDAA